MECTQLAERIRKEIDYLIRKHTFNNATDVTVHAGPEPMFQLVRFWPDHFLPHVHSVLIYAWNWPAL